MGGGFSCLWGCSLVRLFWRFSGVLGFEDELYVFLGKDLRFISWVIILGECLLVVFDFIDVGFGVEGNVGVFFEMEWIFVCVFIIGILFLNMRIL